MIFAEKFLNDRFPIIGEERMRLFTKETQVNGNHGNAPKRLKSNTTVFALAFNKGVIVAGDRRMSDGYLGIVSDTTTKICRLTQFSAMACAGDCMVISFLENNMEATCRHFEASCKQELSPDGQATYLKRLLEPWWHFFVNTWYPTIGIPVLATYDIKLERPRIFSFDSDGFFWEPRFLAGTGCGFDYIKALLVDGWRRNINEEEAIRLAMCAMIHSGNLSHGVSDTRMVLPTVTILDQSGFRPIQENNLKRYRDQLVKKMEGLNV